MSRRAAPSGEVTIADAARKRRQGTLASRLEEALLLQPGLELLEGELERAHPSRFEQFHDELVAAALGIDLEAAEGQHVHAVARLEAQAGALASGRGQPAAGPPNP